MLTKTKFKIANVIANYPTTIRVDKGEEEGQKRSINGGKENIVAVLDEQIKRAEEKIHALKKASGMIKMIDDVNRRIIAEEGFIDEQMQIYIKYDKEISKYLKQEAEIEKKYKEKITKAEDPHITDQLKKEREGLLSELKNLKARADYIKKDTTERITEGRNKLKKYNEHKTDAQKYVLKLTHHRNYLDIRKEIHTRNKEIEALKKAKDLVK